MVNFRVLVAAFVCASTSAFAPQQAAVVSKPLAASNIKSLEVDDLGNNIAVKNVLNSLQEKGILSQVAQSGLLSKAQAAGVSLSNLEPLLALAAENPDVLVLVEASAPEILPLLPTLVDLAPAALPLLSLAISIPPQVVGALGLASAAAAAGAVVIIPDDTVAQVAAQTLIAGVFGLAVPVVSLGGAAVLSKLTK